MFAKTLNSTFSKTLTAGVLSLTLVLTSLTPSSAQAGISDDEAIAGFLTLLLLGTAIHNRNDRSEQATTPRRDWRVLPARCIREHTRRNGNTIRIFGQTCMNNNYARTNRLPQACHVRFRNQNGQVRQGYRVRCMQNQGFRTTRR